MVEKSNDILRAILIVGAFGVVFATAVFSMIERSTSREHPRNGIIEKLEAEKTLSKDPTNYAALLQLGDCYVHEQQLPKAVETYTMAIAANPGERDAYLKRAVAYNLMDDFTHAQQDRAAAAALPDR